ncbi:MAG: hypothetical protein J6T67_00520 [Paludibacteraceae bacterium]|nr:hypothetical protein [Paludibacteraceae bacterium]MBR4712645.1 hypothetical protein [Paludibacteraceae bacterium]MBR5375460.1 hypothetical protein [Paludibacteraceae bacterium]
MDIEHIIEHGKVFRKSSDNDNNNNKSTKVKTKAKKTTYIKGAHGSDSAKMKAEYRRKRANRHK